MNKKKCEVCGLSHTVKNGTRKGVQLYKCQECRFFLALAESLGMEKQEPR